MTTLAKHVIVVGSNNHPPMMEKSMYTFWVSRMLLYIKGKEHRRIMLSSVLNGPLIYSTIEVDGVTRPSIYDKLSKKETLQDYRDLRAKNIVFHGLPPDIYALVNHNQVAKQIWDRVKLIMQAWFKEKLMMVEVHESGQVLDEEQLAFLADPWVAVGQDSKTTMPLNVAFQTNDLDAFDSDCYEAPGASVILMAHLSICDSDVISKVPNSDNHQNDTVPDMCVQEESYFEQLTFNLDSNTEITSDSNIIFYEQYLKETESPVAKCTADNLTQKELDASLTTELDSLKFTLSKHEKEKASLLTKINDLKKKSKEIEAKYIDEAIDIEKQKKELEMHCLQSEQAFWLRLSNPTFEQPVVQTKPVKMDAPRKLPKLSDSLSFLCVICFVTHSRQPPWETRILSALLETTPNLATMATGIPLSSLYETTWYLFDLTPSDWCKTDAHSTDFGSRIQTNTSRISLNLWTHLTLMVKIGKERACVYFDSPFAIKLATGLNAFHQDPSPHGRILLPDSLLNSFHQEGPQNSATIS
uniref:Uncharacterized protein n=1 Tax=Tanacetum cinerariifolium TaxID=118510 RepID=A0A6L2LH45_TANCI|nr:hypothetical protein [Tanacetum cinerariifolium]